MNSPLPIAIIDMGSNTFHLDVFDASNLQRMPALAAKSFVLKLGRYLVDEQNQPAAVPEQKMDESCAKLAQLVQMAQEHGAKKIYIVATSVLRDALNALEFRQRCEQTAGQEIEVLSGEEEAQLAFESAGALFDLSSGQSLIMDIGGGSCELVRVKSEQACEALSLPIGFSKLLTRCALSENPQSQDELKVQEVIVSLLNQWEKELPFVLEKENWDKVVVTSSVLKVIALIVFKKESRWELKDCTIEWTHLEKLKQKIISQKNITGLKKSKRDLIFLGTVFFQEILKRTRVQKLNICPWSIREAYVRKNLKA